MRALLAIAVLVGCSAKHPDWNRKDAFRQCGAAIDAYPDRAAPPCSALHICANEAQLTAAQQKKLDRMVAETKCAPL